MLSICKLETVRLAARHLLLEMFGSFSLSTNSNGLKGAILSKLIQLVATVNVA